MTNGVPHTSGTKFYHPYELLSGNMADTTSEKLDVYCLGMVLYNLVMSPLVEDEVTVKKIKNDREAILKTIKDKT